MGQERLNSLAFLCVESKLLRNLSVSSLINDLNCSRARIWHHIGFLLCWWQILYAISFFFILTDVCGRTGQNILGSRQMISAEITRLTSSNFLSLHLFLQKLPEELCVSKFKGFHNEGGLSLGDRALKSCHLPRATVIRPWPVCESVSLRQTQQ